VQEYFVLSSKLPEGPAARLLGRLNRGRPGTLASRRRTEERGPLSSAPTLRTADLMLVVGAGRPDDRTPSATT